MLRTCGFLVLGLVLGYVIYVLRQSPAGYCAEQNRFISDEEFIYAVIPIVQVYATNFNKRRTENSLFSNWDGYVPESKDVGCCKIDRRETYSLFNRMFGLQTVEVWVSPMFKKRPDHWSDGVRFSFDMCGELLDTDLGFRSTVKEPITTRTLLGE